MRYGSMRGIVALVGCLLAGAASVQAGPLSIGTQIALGTDQLGLNARVEWGEHHGLRASYETGFDDYSFVEIESFPGGGHYDSEYAHVALYSVSYEYSLASHHARSTAFLGAGPGVFRGHANIYEYESSYSQAGSLERALVQDGADLSTVGFVAYAGYRTAVMSSLRMTASIRGRWSSESFLYIPPRGRYFDFDGLSAVFGLDWGF